MILQPLRQVRLLILILLASLPLARGQSTPKQVNAVLDSRLQSPELVAFQLRQYLIDRIAKLPAPTSAEQWTATAQQVRKHLLEKVVFHGWPPEWISSSPKFEDLGPINAGEGHRMRKLRYEIVPGFFSTAILYEPVNLRGKVPAILNVSGHEYSAGKAVEYEQKRCINFAKHGIMALSLEWFECGELFDPENKQEDRHWVGGYLDLVGANAVGLFYLAMRRGLDYLYEHPNVDQARLGMTGLSGGGWQTITLSSLDQRVQVAVPVAGYASLVSEIERASDTGDIEQIPADFFVDLDNTHLTAMRAPRPTLLVYNAEDDCCFRAPLVKPYLFDQVQPFFSLYGSSDGFQWHENDDPGTHNYQLDNRLQAYHFFAKHFRLPAIDSEIPSDAEVKSYDELVVGLPKDNLTVLRLARSLAQRTKREPIPLSAAERQGWAVSARGKLKAIIRCDPSDVKLAWALANTKGKGIETRSYRFGLSNGLSATGVWVKAIKSPDTATATLMLNDEGKRREATEVSARVNRGDQVLAIDLLFTGDSSPEEQPQPLSQRQYLIQLLATVGNRALGIEAAQLIAITQWLHRATGTRRLRLECTGMRSQTVALVASALEPTLFSEVVVRRGMRSLSYLLDTPVSQLVAPDLFCLDLYKEFDLDRMIALAEPTKITQPSHFEEALAFQPK
jgi:dienelactone hydrolase